MENQARCISHEIRNQISICELYSRIIRKNLENCKIKNSSIDNALNCIERSLKVMNNNLLDLKSLGTLEVKEYNIRDILKEAVNLSVVYVQDKDIEFSVHCPDSVNVLIDDNKFLACIINILKNAIESIDEKGFVHLSEEISCNKVIIKISNNGKQITEPEHIFDEGFTTKSSGSGLGLFICKRNLEMFNGQIKLNKSTKNSTEFEITLPVYI